jgi:hypothetical protein
LLRFTGIGHDYHEARPVTTLFGIPAHTGFCQRQPG